MIPPETVQKIREAAQIVDVVSDFVSLRRRGSVYMACCPFHNEKTPSFVVTPSRGMYKCFGCGKAGSAISFVMEYGNMTYPEALRYLAKKYNIEIVEEQLSADVVAARQRNESLLLASEFASKFFVESLGKEEGRALGYAYFKMRGLDDETITKWGLGWAPSSRSALITEARKSGYKDEYLIGAGLCMKYDDGRVVDRFYDRAIFPIHSPMGRVIAFGGRTLRTDKSVAKYVNSPETEIYDKSRSLYGIYFAKHSISKEDRCYLVEGYLDVLSMHQKGITNVVASSGTSLTVPQVQLIKRFTDNVTIMYDGDSAGIHAALRGIGLVLREGMNVRVVLIPDGDDPDSYSRKHTSEEIREFIKGNEKDFIEFKTDLLLSEVGSDPLRRAELINDIADTIALIPDPVKRITYAQASAQKFGISDKVIFERITATRERMGREDAKAAARVQSRQQFLASQAAAAQPQSAATPVETAPLPTRPPGPPAGTSTPGGPPFENKVLQPCEEELLYFILNYGTHTMDFESDSPFNNPEGNCTVAEFIRSFLENDNARFVNSLYSRAYDAYFDLYDGDANLSQEEITRAIIDSEDRTTANLVANMVMEKYPLTVEKFRNSMTAVSTRLVRDIPKSILVYNVKRLTVQLSDLTSQLKSLPDGSPAQMECLMRIKEFTDMRKGFEEKLGRIT